MEKQESYIVTTAINAKGASIRYTLAGSTKEVRDEVEFWRREGKMMPVPDDQGGPHFYVDPFQVVSIYPKEA